ncbi:amidase [Geosmithia morbida]|uniref:Amidase n=1 Tax=Geosmithia morbida TaxID=1094350 RepID=A0A9P5D4B3_9HYPO|nr:amidase [Geosmithia morbida]KAF4125867.1 amidase [Geosmithia morbida]
MKQSWEQVRECKRAQQIEAITQAQEKIQDLDAGRLAELVSPPIASQLVGLMSKGEATATEVAKAYITSLTEICFNDALTRAAELDGYLKTHGKVVGPLHGVPVTLKDQFDVKGVDTTIGYVSRCFTPASDDAALVKILRSLGAIIIAKTNLPQSIMWCETENPLWGLTTNPLRKTYTPGGSTGGESALLSCQGSMLGWGTDIGGSIRIPAHMMGLYGLKPSSARLPYRGVPVSQDGQEHVPSSVGPLARDLETILTAMSSVVGARPWDLDPRCAPIPWRQEEYTEALDRPLTIAVLHDDGVVRPHPPISRVLRETVDRLRGAGHDIFEWNSDLHPDCVAVMDKFYTIDGGEDLRSAVLAGGEPFIPHVERLINAGQAISVFEYWQLNKKKVDIQQRYLDKWLSLVSPNTGRPADVILMPPMPHPAVPHKGCRWVGYTKVWNFLDYPALVLPGGSVGRQDLSEPFDHEARNLQDEWTGGLWRDRKEEMAELKLPVGVQLICRKLEEEKLMAIGKVVDDVIRSA